MALHTVLTNRSLCTLQKCVSDGHVIDTHFRTSKTGMVVEIMSPKNNEQGYLCVNDNVSLFIELSTIIGNDIIEIEMICRRIWNERKFKWRINYVTTKVFSQFWYNVERGSFLSYYWGDEINLIYWEKNLLTTLTFDNYMIIMIILNIHVYWLYCIVMIILYDFYGLSWLLYDYYDLSSSTFKPFRT